MPKQIRRWFVSAYDKDDRFIKPNDVGMLQQHFDGLSDAQFEAARLLARYCDDGGPEPYIAYCNILVAVANAEKKTVVKTVKVTPYEEYTYASATADGWDDSDKPVKKAWN